MPPPPRGTWELGVADGEGGLVELRVHVRRQRDLGQAAAGGQPAQKGQYGRTGGPCTWGAACSNRH